jgi:hypothetical protein
LSVGSAAEILSVPHPVKTLKQNRDEAKQAADDANDKGRRKLDSSRFIIRWFLAQKLYRYGEDSPLELYINYLKADSPCCSDREMPRELVDEINSYGY